MRELHATVFGETDLKRQGLARVLFPSHLRIETATFDAIGEKRAGESQPRIALVCVEQGRDVGRVVQELRARFEESKIVVIADHDIEAVVGLALHHGAMSFLTEAMSVQMLRHALEIIAEGAMVLPHSASRHLMEPKVAAVEARYFSGEDETTSVNSALSERELAILTALSSGDSNKLIARKLGIAEATVKVHVKTILRKIGLRNRTQAAIWSLTTRRRTAPPMPANGPTGEDHGLPPGEVVLAPAAIEAVPFGVGRLS